MLYLRLNVLNDTGPTMYATTQAISKGSSYLHTVRTGTYCTMHMFYGTLKMLKLVDQVQDH